MTEELKRCPFCGGEAKIVKDEVNEGGFLFWVECSNCKSSSDIFFNRKEAIDVWNRRANPLQKWEAGSKPPNGWYFFVNKNAKGVYYIDNGKAIVASVGRAKAWETWLDVFQVYGPIPEPEV